jgi:hypothetical protein
MSENSQPIAEEQENFVPLTHRRILIVMGTIAAFGSLLSLVFISWQFGLGVFIGGINLSNPLQICGEKPTRRIRNSRSARLC